jgi:hypothetical protein
MMCVRKFGVLLALVVLISSVAFATLVLADAPPHTTDWSTNPPTADSLVVGVPYEDGGAATNAGEAYKEPDTGSQSQSQNNVCGIKFHHHCPSTNIELLTRGLPDSSARIIHE